MIVMPEIELLTLEEAGESLGVSKYTIRAWIDNGTLEGVKIGSRWKVRPEAITSYVIRNTKQEGIPSGNIKKKQRKDKK
jgi:excisionase family DNA binding protein